MAGTQNEERPLLAHGIRPGLNDTRGAHMSNPLVSGLLVASNIGTRIATGILIKMAFNDDADTNLLGLLLLSNVAMVLVGVLSYTWHRLGLVGIAEIWSDEYGAQRLKYYFMNGALSALSFVCIQSSLEFVSISVYTMGAVLQIPGTMLLQYMLLNHRVSSSTVLSVSVLTLLTLSFPLLGSDGTDGVMDSAFAGGVVLICLHVLFISSEQATYETAITADRGTREVVFALEVASFPIYLVAFICLTTSRGLSFDMGLMDSMFPPLVSMSCIVSRCVMIVCLHIAVKDVVLYTATKALRIVLGSVAQVAIFGESLSVAQWVLTFIIPLAVMEFTFVKSAAQVNCLNIHSYQ